MFEQRRVQLFIIALEQHPVHLLGLPVDETGKNERQATAGVVPTKNPIRGRQTRATDGEEDGSFGRRGESVPMARFGACSLGVDIAGGNSSMRMDGAAPQPQQRSRAAIGAATLGMLGLRLRRRVGTRDEDRRCEEKQRPYRGRVIRPGAVPEIVYPTRDAFAPRDNRKSRIAGAA